MHSALTISDVVVPIDHGVAPFELGVACELFGLDRSDQGLPVYRFALASVSDGPVRTTAGFTLVADDGLERLDTADLICLVAGDWTARPPSPALVSKLHAAHRRGAHLMAICRGAFVLARTGLLDGRRATTHWRWSDELAASFPRITVEPGVLYVDTGDISTSAGTAAGLDLGLHLLRRAHGAAVSAEIARRMVVPPHREGGQAQYLHRPLADHANASDDPIGETLSWALLHIDKPLTVARLADRAAMAPRTFARRVVECVGTPPHQWLAGQRIRLAQELLETTEDPVTAIARRCGFGSIDALRAAFTQIVGAPPTTYRRNFQTAARNCPISGVTDHGC